VAGAAAGVLLLLVQGCVNCLSSALLSGCVMAVSNELYSVHTALYAASASATARASLSPPDTTQGSSRTAVQGCGSGSQ
jgi:hypothetical protein